MRALKLLAPLVIVVVFGGGLLQWWVSASTPRIAPIKQLMGGPADWPPSADVLTGTPPEWLLRQLPIRTCKIKCITPWVGYQHRWVQGALPSERLALFIPYVDTNVAAYLNGVLIGQEGRMTMPPTHARFRPRLFDLPTNALRVGENVVSLVVVREHRGWGGIAPIYIGPRDQLERPYQWRQFVVHELMVGMSALLGVSLLIALALLGFGQREPVMVWFVVASSCWLVLLIVHLVSHPISAPAWTVVLLNAAGLGCLCFTALFGLALSKAPDRRIVRGLVGWFLVGIGLYLTATFLPGIDDWFSRLRIPQEFTKYSAYLLIPIGFIAIFRYAMQQTQAAFAGWIAAFFLVPALLGLAGLRLGVSTDMPLALVPMGGVGIAFAFWLELARRMQDNARRMRAFNAELKVEVSAREAELRASFARLSEIERARSLADERTRIMRDMHDGVGGQLTMLLSALSNDRISKAEVAAQLQQSLEDLRLVVDSLQASPGDDLLETLGVFRERVTPRLRQANIALNWRADPKMQLKSFGPDAALTLFRVLQEAITNVLRHAKAKSIEMHIFEDHGDLLIEVRDDGHGGVDPAVSRGRGMGNMAARLAQLGGELKVLSSGGDGTCLQMRVPQPA